MCVSVLDVVDQIVYYPYMPSIVGKKRGNQTYYYLVESARVNGKPRPLAHPRPRCCRDPAMAANRTQDTTFLGARYRRLARRIGKLKALVAIEHSILTATWHVLSENTDYHDLGGDYHTKRDPQRALRRITRDANRLGYTVRFDPIQAA